MTMTRNPVVTSDKPKLWYPGIRYDHPLVQGVFGLWPFWEGGGKFVHDVSGFGNHGLMTNMIPDADWVKTTRGYMLDFDSTNDFINIVVKSFATLNPNMTIAIGVTPNDITVSEYISDFNNGNIFSIVKGYQSGYYNVYGGAYPAGGSAANSQIPASGNGVRDFVVWTKYGTHMKGYVNGVKHCDITITTGNWTPSLPAFDIGHRWGGIAATVFGGQIDFYGIWSRALTASEVIELYYDPFVLITPKKHV